MRPERRPNRRQRVEWPAWRFSPDGESAMFDCPEDVPDGWTNKPQLQYEAPVDPVVDICEETVIQQLKAKSVKVDPTWGKAKLWEELEKVL